MIIKKISIVNGEPYEFWFDDIHTERRMFYKGGGKPSMPKPPEVVTKVEDIANEEIKRQKRRSYIAGGKQSTILAGIETQLKERLG